MTTLLGLDLAGRPVLVVGGGPVAARRTRSLLGGGALVTVAAPLLCEDLVHQVQEGRITWTDREAVAEDVDGMWLVQVVPGVTSALSAPAAAGIPVTHRGVAAGVHITHGHARLDEAAVCAAVTGSCTPVILMGVATLPDHCERLIAAGVDPATPVAIIERGTTDDQRVTSAPLVDVAALAVEQQVVAPAVIVVGAMGELGAIGAA